MIFAGPSDAAATVGTPQAIASTITWPKLSRADGSTSRSAAASSSGSSDWSYQPASIAAGSPSRSIASAGCSPSHSPGWPPTSTSEAGSAIRSRASANASSSSPSRLTSVKRPT